jgi:hypothetical protein
MFHMKEIDVPWPEEDEEEIFEFLKAQGVDVAIWEKVQKSKGEEKRCGTNGSNTPNAKKTVSADPEHQRGSSYVLELPIKHDSIFESRKQAVPSPTPSISQQPPPQVQHQQPPKDTKLLILNPSDSLPALNADKPPRAKSTKPRANTNTAGTKKKKLAAAAAAAASRTSSRVPFFTF